MVITDKKIAEIKEACVKEEKDYTEVKSRLCLTKYSIDELITECSQVKTEDDLKKVLIKANRIKSHNKRTDNNLKFISDVKTLIKQLYKKDAVITPGDFSYELCSLEITKGYKTEAISYTFKLLQEEGYLEETKIRYIDIRGYKRTKKAYKFI